MQTSNKFFDDISMLMTNAVGVAQGAKEEAETAIYKARKNKDNFLVFIHGKGKGRLKEELHSMLDRTERIEFYDAEYSLYSGGATEVKLY